MHKRKSNKPMLVHCRYAHHLYNRVALAIYGVSLFHVFIVLALVAVELS